MAYLAQQHAHGDLVGLDEPLPKCMWPTRRGLILTMTMETTVSAKNYAERVQDHSAVRSSQSLNAGDDFRDLAKFLRQPYVSRPRLLSPSDRDPPALPKLQPCFASLYHITENSTDRLQFTTIEEFDSLGEKVLPARDSFAMLLLQGYPAPEWLNTLGGRFSVDPEFFQRHLLFETASSKGPPKHSSAQFLPSRHGNMLSLRISTLGFRQSGDQLDHGQGDLDALRRKVSDEMGRYISKIASLNHPDVQQGDSVVRQFFLHDSDNFSLEQTLSLAIQRAGDAWMGM